MLRTLVLEILVLLLHCNQCYNVWRQKFQKIIDKSSRRNAFLFLLQLIEYFSKQTFQESWIPSLRNNSWWGTPFFLQNNVSSPKFQKVVTTSSRRHVVPRLFCKRAKVFSSKLGNKISVRIQFLSDHCFVCQQKLLVWGKLSESCHSFLRQKLRRKTLLGYVNCCMRLLT